MTSPPFEIEPLPDGSGYRIAGDLDLATAPQLGAVLIGVQPADGLVLDLADVTFIDSSGCSALLSCVGSGDGGTRLTIANPSPTVLRSLELMGLHQHPGIEFRQA